MSNESSGHDAEDEAQDISAPGGPDPSAPSADKGQRRPAWEAISVSVAVLSLGVAVFFNARAVSDNADQAALSRQATQLGTMFEVEQAVRRSGRRIFSPRIQELTPVELEFASRAPNGELPTLRRQFVEAMNDFDYIAFLFNNNYLTIRGARGRWQNQLNCAWALAIVSMPRTAPEFWSELRSVARHRACAGPTGKHEIDEAEALGRQRREELRDLERQHLIEDTLRQAGEDL